ncbi:MAG: AAA domain-containing protein [Desulfuromonadaceae bacterium]
MPPVRCTKRVSKSTLSMFLRTRCDKELFLSLHDKTTMGAAGMPEPVKRPGIGTLSVEGREFEVERNDQLARLFPGIICHNRGRQRYDDVALEPTLLTLTAAPAIILQGRFSVSALKDQTLGNIGLTAAEVADVPDIADFIPDMLVVRAPLDGDLAIQPDGLRRAVTAQAETRLAIDIFDIKHTSEANPSYCAEIAMYALMLANWLHHHPVLMDRYYVTTNAFLWTRFRQGDSELDRLEQAGGATMTQLLAALVADSEDANLHFYLATVRRFFEDVVRVIRIGDAAPLAWQNLEWHVCGSCSNCDWLGDKRHLGQSQRAVVDANPQHYCMPAARMSGHLSLVPGITRGARKILQRHAVPDTQSLATAPVGHPALQLHTVLKREARSLPARSSAIMTGTIGNDTAAVISSLAGSANLVLYASINFDSSSGLLTGLALSGTATSFTRGQAPRRFPAVPFLVDQKTLQAEWVALEGFLSHIASCIDTTEAMVANPTGQIHFWEERQFKELCNAMGRHLPRVLALTTRRARALAWLFPPEELIGAPAALEAATVVTVEDIVRRLVFTPTPHVITLFDTAEHYNNGFVSAVRDSYYREYLSNGIPRERIYEIWSNAPQVRRGTVQLPRNTVIAQYSDALEKQSKSLESVCERIRTDYRGQFRARSHRIPLSIPQGTTGVAFDGKLWVWWDSLEFCTSQLESHIRLALEGERLEATYEAIILRNGRQVSQGVYDFDVSRGSLEAKFKEDSMLTLGKIGHPGLSLERVNDLIRPGSPPYQGSQNVLMMPLWSILRASLLQFDRVNAMARVELTYDREPALVPYLLSNASMDLLTDVFLLETKKPGAFDWSRYSSPILREISNPAIATPDQNAANAMGIPIRTRRGGTAPVTPAARVLWEPGQLEQQTVVPNATANAIAAHVVGLDRLNMSQEAAVVHAVERALTVIWGPPGTGKTNTLAALLHGLAWEAATGGRPLKILVTGPTYKAVEEIMHRAAEFISADPGARCAMFLGYSWGRALGGAPAGLSAHVSYAPITLDNRDPRYQSCLQELAAGAPGVVIIGCQVRQCRRFPNDLLGSFVRPVFDVVIVDESSQVPVSQSLSALCGLKDNARLIIAGDHLQMPPIASIEPPTDAAYLVGSIQTYLNERQFATPVARCVLETNYRSNEDIVAFARSIGYPSTLNAGYPDTALRFLNPLPNNAAYPAHLPWCAAFNDLMSPDHKAVTLLHEDEVSSQGNHFEARVVAGIVWMLRNSVGVELDGHGAVTTNVPPPPHRFWGECVGVVTPHRAQRALVIRELGSLFPGEKDLIDSAVDTVERFQGGERHTIIVTFGVADTDVIGGEEAFLMQLERTNVAVSRAMAKCIVVMPKTLAAHIPEDKRALATAFALKLYIEEFCNMRVDTTLSDTAETRRAQVRFHR